MRLLNEAHCAFPHCHAGLKQYIQPASPKGLLGAILSRALNLFRSGVVPQPKDLQDQRKALDAYSKVTAMFNEGPRIASRADRETLREYVAPAVLSTTVDPLCLFTAGMLPIFRVYNSQPDSAAAAEGSPEMFAAVPPAVVRSLIGRDNGSVASLTLKHPVAPVLMTRQFIITTDAPVVVEMVHKLGAFQVSRPAFYAEYVFPRLATLSHADRDAAMLAMLSELVKLCLEDQSFRATVASTAFVPCPRPAHSVASGAEDPVCLRVPSEVYDPSLPDLLALVEGHLFPIPGPFRSPEILSVLRTLGLQTTMTRTGIKAAAASIDAACRSGPEAALAAVPRAQRLLSYIDEHAAVLFAHNPVAAGRVEASKATKGGSSGGLLTSVTRLFSGSTGTAGDVASA